MHFSQRQLIFGNTLNLLSESMRKTLFDRISEERTKRIFYLITTFGAIQIILFGVDFFRYQNGMFQSDPAYLWMFYWRFIGFWVFAMLSILLYRAQQTRWQEQVLFWAGFLWMNLWMIVMVAIDQIADGTITVYIITTISTAFVVPLTRSNRLAISSLNFICLVLVLVFLHEDPKEISSNLSNGLGVSIGGYFFGNYFFNFQVFFLLNELRLEHQNKKAEKLTETFRQFLYIISHDLREPLRNITNFSQLLWRRLPSEVKTSENQDYYDIVEKGTRNMNALLEGLRQYDTVESRLSPPSEESPRDLLLIVLNNLKTQIDECGARIHFAELPEKIYTQPLLLIQLFQNLISNAIKFRGAEAPEITISCIDQGKCWAFSVKDNGIGIDPKYQDRIFGLFAQAHKGQFEGAGMGLAICQKITELLGGQIKVCSTPGVGSEFRFTHDKSGAMPKTEWEEAT